MPKFAFAILGVLLTVSSWAAGPYYFAEIYGYQNWRNAAAFSHTFASFYEVSDTFDVTRIDISWIPQDQYLPGVRDLRMPAFGDWPGQNLTLEATISRGKAARREVVPFGPYEASRELFVKAQNQVAWLKSGRITYRGLDMATRPYSVNCVHAVTGMVGEFKSGLRRGPGASEDVARFFQEMGYLGSVRKDWAPVLHGQRARSLQVIH